MTPNAETLLWCALGVAAGVTVRRMWDRRQLRRSAPRPQLFRVDLGLLLAQAEREGLAVVLARILEGDRMKVSVAVGAQMSREAWETVTVKLLDLVGGGMDGRDRDAVSRFISRSVRAWPDLEQRARAENPDAAAPAAPID